MLSNMLMLNMRFTQPMIGIRTQLGKLEAHSTPAKLHTEGRQARSNRHWTQPTVDIDQYPSRHAYGNDNSPTLYDLYDLSGRYITTLSQHQLGVSLGSRESAVVVLPNCVGGTPNIVRKHRLK